MMSIAFFTLIIAFYIFYNTSKKVVKNKITTSDIWIKNNLKSTKFIDLIFLFFAFILHIYTFGTGVGTLIFCITIITSGSLIILLSPLGFINRKTIIIFFLLSISLELFIF